MKKFVSIILSLIIMTVLFSGCQKNTWITGYDTDSKTTMINSAVVAENGIMSDALSTACLLAGEKKAVEILESVGASAILVDESFNITTVGEIEFEQQ